ncbi:phosphoenolpyruvate--protein phosphotransferase [Nicoliella spurrieriana]|uniref:Phosphoenolpyruvate-protein phosphotransferase n=1 Tax=Nicoliella spurrieriana TaxID=2925830 RepID=A0A976X596_9LACO|nr:phosphoenolpyruvate--protein phosphotransferase [Nicoliella spurrieriana]UQS86416.1 phosphoenolpyruvate--protein phosphotransferase [Nicoliella spurrieriana]
MHKIEGISASEGISIARAYKIIEPDLSFPEVTVKNKEAEINRLHDALRASINELSAIKKSVVDDLGNKEGMVFESHIQMLSDPDFISSIEQLILDKGVCAEKALDVTSNNFIHLFKSNVTNVWMRAQIRERTSDVIDIKRRVLSHLLNVKLPDLSLVDRPVIIVAKDITPSDIAQLNGKYVKGIIAEFGAQTSHSTIMARTLKLPMILRAKGAINGIRNDDQLIVDGLSGMIIVNPTQLQIIEYHKKSRAFHIEMKKLVNFKEKLTTTQDGRQLSIEANIGNDNDLVAATNSSAEGIGLYRTEFLFLGKQHLPTEDEQFESYRKAVFRMNGRPTVFRTLDIGNDKQLNGIELPDEENPALGIRGIRVSLSADQLFRTQLRALIRASSYGEISIIFPMISTIHEYRRARKIYDEERAAMKRDGQNMGSVNLGVMIEVPSAALLADEFAKEVDVVSIGTNDLVQYIMAADRMDSRVADLYQQLNPAVLRILKYVVDAFHVEGKSVSICGEMASSRLAVPLLVGMGVDCFSMNSDSILKIRKLISQIDSKYAKKIVNDVITNAATSDEVVQKLNDFLDKI